MRAALIAALVLNLYVLGAMLVFALITYPSFMPLDREAYRSFNQTIGVAVVPFELLAFLAPLALYVWRPEPFAAVHAVTALGVAYFVITFVWHLPAHRPLAAGTASDLTVLMSSQWARTVVQVARTATLAWLTARAFE